MRGRIQAVLEQSTEFSTSHTAPKRAIGDWERAYEEYYGLYTPETEKPFYPYFQGSYESYFTLPTQRVKRRMSCFAAGTPIATASGPRAVESLKAGDRVLTQDIDSGELSFRPIAETTIRPAIEMVEIHCGTTPPIVATPGHPFWVVGQGWQIARLLKPGDRLHSVHGALTIDEVKRKPPAEAYNLVISGFHTYFVGAQQLLVHDNAPLTEQPQQLPGL